MILKRIRQILDRLSISLRFTLMVLLVVLAAAVTGYSSIVYWQLSAQREQVLDFTDSVTQLVAQDFAKIIRLNDLMAAADLSAKLSAFPPLRRAVLFDPQNAPRYRYVREGLPPCDALSLPERLPHFENACHGNAVRVFREASYAGIPLGVVLIEMETETLASILRRDALVLSLITLMVVVLSLVLARSLARQFNQPVLRLAGFLDEVGRYGKLDSRIETTQQNEIGRLYRDVNNMLARLEESTQAMRIATAAFEAPDGMMITDASNVILRVNRGFTRITGYTADEAVGKTPALLASGRHDNVFYDDMWCGLRAHDRWEGEIWNRHRDGTIFPCRLTIQAVRDEQGEVRNFVGALFDISRQKSAEAELAFLDRFDPLTGLANRRQLLDKTADIMVSAACQSGRHAALMCFDINDFKRINDTFGHRVGDCLLVEISRRLRKAFNNAGFVARLGGDEFAVVLQGLATETEAAVLDLEMRAESVLLLLGKPYTVNSETIRCLPCCGIALFTCTAVSPESILQQAQAALHHAKTAPDRNWSFYDPGSQLAARRYQSILTDLESALADGSIQPYYQVQVADGGRVVGVELLARWRVREGEFISPSVFIPVAERSGLIHVLGTQMLRQACQQLVEWRSREAYSQLSISVNVTAQQFLRQDFVSGVKHLIAETGVEPYKLKLELTESAMIEDIDLVVEKMQALSAFGIRISLDDFGTGYSCLRYLKRLPLDQVKIDQSFVRDMGSSQNDVAIVRSILSLGATLGFEVIAEGVEDQSQYEALHALGCRYFQGYWFGKPVPAEALDLSV